MRTFLLLLALDVAVVAGGLALFGHDSPRSSGEAESDRDVARVEQKIRTLDADARRMQERLDALEVAAASNGDSGVPPPVPAGPAPMFPEDELERLEAALIAVEKRRAVALGRETLRMAVKHVFPDLTAVQRDHVAEAIAAYRGALTRALEPGSSSISDEAYEQAVGEIRRRLEGVVDPGRIDAIVKKYAVKPGPPRHPPEVSKPVRRR